MHDDCAEPGVLTRTHTLTRTVLIVVAWYAFPEQRFLTIPWIIVALYLVTILVLEKRWRRVRGATDALIQT